jgi:DNA-binding transcriptional regulator PaaX
MSSYSKTILEKLAEKPALPVEALKDKEPKAAYALTRALKNLVEGGYAEIHKSERQNYARITKRGKTKLHSLLLEDSDALVPRIWDGLWRVIILDLPENRKSEREALRYLLKKANFVCVKNTVWISPFPYEHLFKNIKKDLGLTTELMILVTEKLDEETHKAFLAAMKG